MRLWSVCGAQIELFFAYMKYKVRELGGAYTTAQLEPMIQAGMCPCQACRPQARRSRSHPPRPDACRARCVRRSAAQHAADGCGGLVPPLWLPLKWCCVWYQKRLDQVRCGAPRPACSCVLCPACTGARALP